MTEGPDVPPSYQEMFRVFGRIGCLSFGGPAAQIALMHQELVERHRWMSERDYLSALSFCMLLPGPEAMQLATYAGWRLRGVAGGLIGGLLFVLPGAALIAALVALYVAFGDLPLVAAGFLGIKAAVVVVVAQALLRLAAKAMRSATERWIAVMAFVAIFAIGLPFPALLAGAALAGLILLRVPDDIAGASATAPQSRADTQVTQGALRASARAIGFWGALWLVPLAGLWISNQVFLAQVGLFFSKLAVVTFGGAYAVLAYLAQAVVGDLGWISLPEMIDALGLAETTPGPLILVTQFVAMLAGHHAGGAGLALAAGLVALWCTFVPCFLWIFAGAPWISWLTALPAPAAALRGITAAVVGVIANLSVWFALHVWFDSVASGALAPLALPLPDPASLNPTALGLTGLAALLLMRLRLGLPVSLALMAVAGGAAGQFI